jgi:hypothetical protein
MNPDLFQTIRNTFQLFLLAFTILAIIKSENHKNTFTFCNYQQNPKITILYNISLFSSFSLPFLLFILFSYSNTETLCLKTTRRPGPKISGARG